MNVANDSARVQPSIDASLVMLEHGEAMNVQLKTVLPQPTMDATSERASSPNNVNDLFDYDVGLDEIFQGQENPASNADAPKPATGDPTSLGLGLDEEVKITKKRQPVAKLDEARLLSQPGIPKLRRAAKQKLRLKGKGHEFSDAARLLNFYQLWLDDLFPRAKFADGLTMIEKLGHTKRIQTMRREWIDEEKPRRFDESRDVPATHDLPTRLSSDQNGMHASEPRSSTPSRPQEGTSGTADQDLFMPDSEAETRPPVSHPEPDDDDLEDLLREQDEVMSGIPEPPSRAPNGSLDDFDAEYEAMNELGL
ncbi:Chromosome segregation in meiosis protein 3 [Penicillium canariense]|uniref:Chromosome segregation in meiosis protein n=1 Tax=Penicillium canariense TaxID=189055 RepID=A0A9W9IGI8_9EURO|nr:Chromosome segregation in meiosis protein 3 [Penicillium canariense]KAJ5175495.1 Chromosome segregation in meiosis protein 3 [Penicillium canariense]